MILICRRGNEMPDVPEYLAHLAKWICRKCAGTEKVTPKNEPIKYARNPGGKRMA